MIKRKKLTQGDVYAIRMAAGDYAIGICCGNDFAFLASRFAEPVLPNDVDESSVAFRILVAKEAIKEENWSYIGNINLLGSLARPATYIARPVGAQSYYAYTNDEKALASKSEAESLEPLAAWFAHHIEERLEDYFSKRENETLKHLRENIGLS